MSEIYKESERLFLAFYYWLLPFLHKEILDLKQSLVKKSNCGRLIIFVEFIHTVSCYSRNEHLSTVMLRMSAWALI